MTGEAAPETYIPFASDVRAIYCGQHPAPDRRNLGAEFDRFLLATHQDGAVTGVEMAALWLEDHGELGLAQKLRTELVRG